MMTVMTMSIMIRMAMMMTPMLIRIVMKTPTMTLIMTPMMK